MSTRDLLTEDERARVGRSLSHDGPPPDGLHFWYTFEHPTRLHDAFVAESVARGDRILVDTLDLGDGFCRCTYRADLPHAARRKVNA